MAKNIESLYTLLSKMSEKLTDVVTDATELNQQAAQYGGEIARIISEQMNQYFIPTITGMVNDIEQPGDIAGIVKFLDSCPLALIREEPAPVTEVPADIVPTPAPVLDNPAGASERMANPVEELPHNISYETIKEPAAEEAPVEPVAEEVPVEAPAPIEEAPIVESVMNEAEEKEEEEVEEEVEAPTAGNWKVIRKSQMAAAIGADLAKLDGQCVFEFDSEEEANEKANMLNGTVLPEEFELFGTEYVVEHDEAPLAHDAQDKREDEEEAKEEKVEEAWEGQKRLPISTAIQNHGKDLRHLKSKEEIIAWLNDTVYPEVEGAEAAKAKLLANVENSRNVAKAQEAVCNFMLADTCKVGGYKN